MKSTCVRSILSTLVRLRSRTALFLVISILMLTVHAQQDGVRPSAALDEPAVLTAYRHVEVASVSDAIEKVMGEKRYLSHRMQAIVPAKFAGYAVTVRLVKAENHDPDALTGMLTAIDEGAKDSVYVMQVEDGQNIAGMGGLMGTAMSAREFAGAVIDGGVRDVAYLRKIGFPVFATGVVPSTSVGHYRCEGVNVPLVVDGVKIAPGDLITADADGVVAVPRARAAEILTLAQTMDFQEHSTYPWIEKLKSIRQAVEKFGRL